MLKVPETPSKIGNSEVQHFYGKARGFDGEHTKPIEVDHGANAFRFTLEEGNMPDLMHFIQTILLENNKTLKKESLQKATQALVVAAHWLSVTEGI